MDYRFIDFFVTKRNWEPDIIKDTYLNYFLITLSTEGNIGINVKFVRIISCKKSQYGEMIILPPPPPNTEIKIITWYYR